MGHRRVLVAIGSLVVMTAILLLLGVVGVERPAAPARGDTAPPPLPAARRAPAAMNPAPEGEGAGARAAAELSPALTLCCEVVSGESAPFPGAAVRVEVLGRQSGKDGKQTFLVTADDQGIARVTIARATAGTVTFAADDPGTWGRAVSVCLQPPHAPAKARLCLFPLDAQLRGVVTGADDRPLPLARVSWMRDLPAVRCDGEGRFTLRVPSGLDGFRCLFLAPGHRSARENVVLAPGDDVELRVRLQPGPRLRGRVTDPDGRPVAGAEVETILQRISGERATTDQDGCYLLDCTMGERDSEQVAVRRAGFVPTSAWVPTTAGDVGHDFVLQAAGTVRGRVLRADGGAAAGAVVSCSPGMNVFGDAGETTTADADGAFVLDELTPGPCELRVRCAGLPPATANATVAAGRSVELAISLQPGLTARGIVVDDAGRPVAGAWVMHSDAHAATDALGRFELRGLPAADGAVDVMESDHLPLRGVPLVAGDNRFVLARAGQLAGRVVDARTGQGLDDFSLAIVGGDAEQGSLGSEWVRSGGRRFRGTAGHFKARGLMLTPGSQWLVRVKAPGCAAAVRTMVAVLPPAAGDGEFALTAGARVSGLVCDAASGAPVAAAVVRLLDHPPEQRVFEPYEPRATSAGDGSFRFEQVAAGPVWVAIDAAGAPPTTAGPFRVGDGDLGLGVVVVGTGVRLTGTLRDAQGQPLGDVALHASSVHADASNPVKMQTRTRADGTFTFTGLQPGPWRLHTSIDTVAGTLAIDQRLQVDGSERRLDVQAGLGVVRGEVRGVWPASSRPFVMVRNAEPGDGRRAPDFFADATLQDRRFCLRGLPAGRYTVTAMVDDGGGRPRYARTPEPVVVTDGAPVVVVLDLGGT